MEISQRCEIAEPMEMVDITDVDSDISEAKSNVKEINQGKDPQICVNGVQKQEEFEPAEEAAYLTSDGLQITTEGICSVDRDSQMSTQIQNISVKEVSDLMAQGESVSFVIVGEGDDALQWIEQAAVIVDNQILNKDVETKRVVVVETDGSKCDVVSEASLASTMSQDSARLCHDPAVSLKRKCSESPIGQATPKVIKVSTEDANISGSIQIQLQEIQNSCDVRELQDALKPNFVSSCKIKSAGRNLADVAQSSSLSKSIMVQESQKVEVKQVCNKEYSPVITIYASSNSSSSSSAGSSSSNQDSLSTGTIPVHQSITVSTLPAGSSSICQKSSAANIPVHEPITIATDCNINVVRPASMTSSSQILLSSDSISELTPIKVSSPGANVELATNGESAESFYSKHGKVSSLGQASSNELPVTSGGVDGRMVYRCAECEYASSNKHYYKQHVDLVHNTARPFKCPFCDYAGKRGHALREHLVVHSAQRPYCCLHCNATFRKKGHLTNHTKLHAASSSNSSTVLSTEVPAGIPGGVASTSNHLLKITTMPPDSTGKLVRIPISVGASGSPLAAKAGSVSQTIMAPSGQKSQASITMLKKRGEFWCALCSKDLADAASFQDHLQAVHDTDHLYACDSCDYITAKKVAIMNHLSTHIKPVAVPTATHTIPTSTSISPLYACTQCGFSTPSMNTLVAHAASHSISGAASSGTSTTSSQTVKSLTQQPHQMSKVICSECGHVADNTEMMRAHMWTHIGAEPRDKAPAPEPQLQKSGGAITSGGCTSTVTASPGPAGLKTLPENAAFKCTECSYISRDASQFVKHMLVHKTQNNQAPKQAHATNSGLSASASSLTGNVSSTTRVSTAYKVKPVTTENTCQNTESSPFVHDITTGRFRCTICGYTCEYQRTIKAHIWKHSGHRQVDYPIFQNGPLSMYEDPVPTSQPKLPLAKTATNPTITNIHVDVTLPSSQSHPTADTKQAAKQTAPAQPADEAASTNPASSSEAAPLSIKFITVSGSQVLHSSGPLPTGKLKLVPMPSASTTKSTPSADTSSKPAVILHVKGAQSESSSKPVASHLLAQKEGPQVSVKLEKETDKLPVGNSAASDKDAISNEVGTVEVKDNHRSDSAESVLQIASAKHVLPTCATAELGPKGIAVPVHSQGDVPKQTEVQVLSQHNEPMQLQAEVPVHSQFQVPMHSVSKVSMHQQSYPNKDTSTAGVVEECLLTDTNNSNSTLPGNAKSTSADFSKDRDEPPTSHADNSSSDQAAASAHDETPSKDDEEGLILGNQIIVKEEPSAESELDIIVKEEPSAESELDIKTEKETGHSGTNSAKVGEKPITTIGVQTRRQSKAEPSVVVEVVNTIPTHTSLTGLRSQHNSPRVPRSMNSSPVNQEHVEAANKDNTDIQAEETNARILRSGKTRGAVKKEKSLDGSVSLGTKTNTSHSTKTRLTMEKSSSNVEEILPINQCSEDSESAVTLLSLLKRGPNLNPACPPKSDQIGAFQKGLSSDNSPDRSPCSSSDIDSVTKEISADFISEDLTSEVESTSSGKTRGGGGGICSTLLAVIEQLRERSRSDSDAEDKLSQPPPKKRPGRRRGRQDSQDEVLDVGDNENIEQLPGEDGGSYRCKLCHYTSPRVPLIRLHMRTHRQKDPFECSLCPMKADSSEMLQEHMIQHCKVRTYACKFCPQSFNHKSTLRAHLRAHNDTDPFLCDLCDFESSSPLEYRAHMQKHAGSTLLRCSHCSTLVASQQDLRLHILTSCPYMSGTSREGERSDPGSGSEATGSDKLECPQCPFTTTEMSRMEGHLASHSMVPGVDGPLRCALCDFTAVSSRSLKSHMKRHANDQRYVQQPLEQYKCSLCGYVCHHLPSLKSHMWRHASDQNYSYHFTNDIINAAIDYDTRADPPVSQQVVNKAVTLTTKEPEEPDLLNRVLSAERKIIEGQMSRVGGSKPVCWVTFRCCQCGFETINKAKLNLHMRTHADIINRALKVNSGSAQEADSVSIPADLVDADGMKMKVVYGPV